MGTEDSIRTSLLWMKTFQPQRYLGLPLERRDYIDSVIEHGTGLFRAPFGDLTGEQALDIACLPPNPAMMSGEGSWGLWAEGCDPGPWKIVDWTVDPLDWDIYATYSASEDPAGEVYKRTREGWHTGVLGWLLGSVLGIHSSRGSPGVRSNSDIILLHSPYWSTVKALDYILPWLKSQGYTFDLLEPSWSRR